MGNLNQTEDGKLWQSFKEGNSDAFSQIYKLHAAALYAYGKRILADDDAVRDVMHTLFVKLWNNRKTTGSTNNIRFFLLRALKNSIITFKTKADKTEALSPEAEENFVFNVTPESLYIQREETVIKAHQLMSAINTLSGRQKEIIYLKYFEELDYTEIAEIMNITVKGAYKLSARALDSLKVVLNSPRSLIIAALLSIEIHFTAH